MRRRTRRLVFTPSGSGATSRASWCRFSSTSAIASGCSGRWAEMGTTDARGLAAATGLDERWLLEWLRGMAAADLLGTADGDTFTMPPAAQAVLVDEDHLAFAAGAFAGGRPSEYVDRLADAFRTGVGPDYDAQG